MFLATFFRTRNIHTLHSPVYLMCRLLERLSVMFVGAFLERGVFTHPFRLFICVRLIISMHGYFTAVTVRHELSWIVAVCANLATRLRSSQSADFFRGRCALPEVHFRYPFSRHDFRLRQVVPIRDGSQLPDKPSQTIGKSHPFLRPVTDQVYWT